MTSKEDKSTAKVRFSTLDESLKHLSRDPRSLLDLGHLEEIRYVTEIEDRDLRIGAGFSLLEMLENDLVQREVPLLVEAISDTEGQFVGLTVSEALMAGVFELATAILALGAFVEIRSRRRRRTVHGIELLGADKSTSLKPGEIITSIVIPSSSRGSHQLWDYQDGKAFAATLFFEFGNIDKPRICVGEAVPVRLFGLERVLRHKPPPEKLTKAIKNSVERELNIASRQELIPYALKATQEFLDGMHDRKTESEPKHNRRRRRIGFFDRSAPSLVFMGMLAFLLFGGYVMCRSTKGRTFKPQSRHILAALTSGDPNQIDSVFRQASPIYRERVILDELRVNTNYLRKKIGSFKRITKIRDSAVHSDEGAKTAVYNLVVEFEKLTTNVNLSFHYYDDDWRLLGFQVAMPKDFDLGEPDLSECEVTTEITDAVVRLSENLSGRDYSTIYREAGDVLRKSKSKKDFSAMLSDHEVTLGKFVRKLDILGCRKSVSGKKIRTDLLMEYESYRTKVEVVWGRVGQRKKWVLMAYRVDMPTR